MNAIELNNVTKRFGSLVAVDHLSLTCKEGEFFSLLGVNGAGKTTTIRILGALTRPDEGDAYLMGHSVLSDTAAAKATANVSPQETAVANKLTVKENLALIAALYGKNKQEAERRADEMIERFALGEVASRRAGLLSGGWQRRLSIAMALITDPKILFLDEPTLGLDVLARRELWAHMRALKGKITVVLTTHYLEEAQALSDRIGVMKKGRLAALGTADELMASAGATDFEEAFIKLVSDDAPHERKGDLA